MRTFLSILGRGCLGLFAAGLLTGSTFAQYTYPAYPSYSTYSSSYGSPYGAVPPYYGYGAVQPYDEAASCWWAPPDCGTWVARCSGGAWQCVAPTIGWVWENGRWVKCFETSMYDFSGERTSIGPTRACRAVAGAGRMSSLPYAYQYSSYGMYPYGMPPAPAYTAALVTPNTTVPAVISTNAFHPQVLRIRRGMTVKWENQDRVLHTVTATDGAFSSPALFVGQAFSHTFRQAGVFYYRCQFHPAMWGVVVVSE